MTETLQFNGTLAKLYAVVIIKFYEKFSICHSSYIRFIIEMYIHQVYIETLQGHAGTMFSRHPNILSLIKTSTLHPLDGKSTRARNDYLILQGNLREVQET